jgi:hypothetical protein
MRVLSPSITLGWINAVRDKVFEGGPGIWLLRCRSGMS